MGVLSFRDILHLVRSFRGLLAFRGEPTKVGRRVTLRGAVLCTMYSRIVTRATRYYSFYYTIPL